MPAVASHAFSEPARGIELHTELSDQIRTEATYARARKACNFRIRHLLIDECDATQLTIRRGDGVDNYAVVGAVDCRLDQNTSITPKAVCLNVPPTLALRWNRNSLLLAGVGDVTHRRAAHIAQPAHIVELGATVRGAAVVPHHQIVRTPAMRVDELPAKRSLCERVSARMQCAPNKFRRKPSSRRDRNDRLG